MTACLGFNPLLIGAAALPRKNRNSHQMVALGFNPLLIGAAALPHDSQRIPALAGM